MTAAQQAKSTKRCAYLLPKDGSLNQAIDLPKAIELQKTIDAMGDQIRALHDRVALIRADQEAWRKSEEKRTRFDRSQSIEHDAEQRLAAARRVQAAGVEFAAALEDVRVASSKFYNNLINRDAMVDSNSEVGAHKNRIGVAPLSLEKWHPAGLGDRASICPDCLVGVEYLELSNANLLKIQPVERIAAA